MAYRKSDSITCSLTPFKTKMGQTSPSQSKPSEIKPVLSPTLSLPPSPLSPQSMIATSSPQKVPSKSNVKGTPIHSSAAHTRQTKAPTPSQPLSCIQNISPSHKKNIRAKKSCQHCGKMYAHASSLSKHIQRDHGGEQEAKGYILCNLCNSRYVIHVLR